MLTLQANKNKPKFNPWKPLVWAFNHPYGAGLLICIFGSPITFALTYVPVDLIATIFAVITVVLWFVGALLAIMGLIFWIVDGGFDDVGDWVRDRARNYGKVEDEEVKKRAFRGKEYTY